MKHTIWDIATRTRAMLNAGMRKVRLAHTLKNKDHEWNGGKGIGGKREGVLRADDIPLDEYLKRKRLRELSKEEKPAMGGNRGKKMTGKLVNMNIELNAKKENWVLYK